MDMGSPPDFGRHERVRQGLAGRAMMNSYLYETIFDLLASQAARRPNDLAIETTGATSLTHGEVFLRTKGLMQALNTCGVSRGSRVAIVLPNGAELALSMLAASSIATSVPLNPAYRGDEYRAYFGEIRVSHLLTLRDFPSAARTVAKERGIPIIELANDASMTIAPNGGLAGVDPQHHESLHETGPARPDDIALILLTSGSTGRSKKVPLSHRNICVSVADICRTLALTPVDRCL